ncbi:MAG: outer membrane lipoprotein-sorting protein [Myxococcota bacterium]|nr:outer membrane lipoprotein-sorting protein [Myxococcota bacterium]
MRTAIAVMVWLSAGAAVAAEPSAGELLKKYDQIMGPATFEAQTQMTSTRDDGSQRTYVMRMLKGEGDKVRIWFQEPSAVKGQEMLRVGDNLWVYLPNLKRATRLANRDSFQGGDFNNADVLRVNYTADYTARLAPSAQPDAYLLELKAKHPETAYDAIKLWVRKSDQQPLRGEYFGTSGQMLRSAEFKEHTEFAKGFTRPALVVMQNQLIKSRRSELRTRTLKLEVNAPAQRFTQADLGR